MQRTSFLDTIWARMLAGVVAVVAAATLAYLNRDMLLGAPAGAGGDELSACLEQRIGDVDAMVSDGTISAGQAAEFRIRARQLCQQTNSVR